MKHLNEAFEVSKVTEEHTGIIEETGLERRIIHIHLDERDLRSKEWHDLRPIGFTEAHCINDFPIRDRKVVLPSADVDGLTRMERT